MSKSKDVNPRTDNSMSKRKRTNGKTMIYKTLYRKQKIEQRNESELRCSESITMEHFLSYFVMYIYIYIAFGCLYVYRRRT